MRLRLAQMWRLSCGACGAGSQNGNIAMRYYTIISAGISVRTGALFIS